MGAVTVKGSLTGGAGQDSGSVSAAGIGAVTIGGSIFAGGNSGAGMLSSTGAIGTVKVSGNLDGTTGTAATAIGVGGIRAGGTLGAVTIVGDIKGGPQATSGFVNSGGAMGFVSVHAIIGGGGQNSGAIIGGNKIAGLTVADGITGGAGTGSGSVQATAALGAVMVKGSLTGKAGTNSGSISAAGIGPVTIGGSILGGDGAGSGVIVSKKAIGAVKVSGSIDGTTGVASTAIGVAGIRAEDGIGAVTILGDLKGGPQNFSGFVDSGGNLGAVVVNSITGGAGQSSGSISAAGKIPGLTVKNNVTGGSGAGAGSVFSGTDSTFIGDLGAVKIGGRLIGGSQDSAGTISSGGKIASVTIGPSAAPANQLVLLSGGAGSFSGSIVSHGAIGAVKITGHVEGGSGNFSGSIWSQDLFTDTLESAGSIAAITISGHLQGGNGDDSGAIRADGNLAASTTADMTGGSGARSGSIRAGQGGIQPGLIGAVTVKGALTGGLGPQSGWVLSEGKIASVTVNGSSVGGSIRAGDDIGAVTFKGDIDTVGVVARGQATPGATTDLAIGKITVLGNAISSRFRAGYDTLDSFYTTLTPVNPDAQIGSVFVKGNWTTGDILAGVVDGGDAGFGTEGDVKISGTDNPKIISQIASIVIGGNVTGAAGGTPHFGFTAQKLGAVKVGATALHFTSAPNESFDVAAGVTAREVPI
jgi:hypothetical protein